MEKKMLPKIQYENLLPKGSGSDQPSLAHKAFIHHIINGEIVNMPKYKFKYVVKKLQESQKEDRIWVPYGRLISEIFHRGGIIQALNETRFCTDEMLETMTCKVINAKRLKHMGLIKKVTPLKSDISESMVVSNLNENFPPICKKDTLAVQMALLSDHFANTSEIIGLEEVPDEMYGGKLPVDQGRKSKRKEMTQEEYLEAEKPTKRAKKEKASEKLKTGGSDVPTVQEEAQELNPDVIIPKKTRSGRAVDPATTTTPEQKTPLKKRKRTTKPRKLKESVYVTEEVEGIKAATELVTREVKRKKVEDAEALQKVLKIAKEIEVPASILSEGTIAIVVEEAIKNAEERQDLVTSEAENLLLASDDVKGVQNESAAGSETISGNSSTHFEPIIEIESESTPSKSNFSSSSTDIDDIPIGIIFKSTTKGQSPKAKLHKKPSKPTAPYKPMDPPVHVRIGELLELKSKKLPPNHPL